MGTQGKVRNDRQGPADKYAELTRKKGDKGGLTWADADTELLAAAVHAVVEDGAALLLSKTSDGGALAIHILASTGKHKLYPASLEELQSALHLIAKAAEG